MDDWDDYYAFQSTTNRDEDSDSGQGGSGCGLLFWILFVLSIVEFVGKLT